METRLLKLFCAVAESESLVTAAKRLHLTPSALSHGLKVLETELGCRLFERAKNKLILNQAGEQLLAEVKPILAGLESAVESIKHLGKWGRQRLRIGAAASACQHILPQVIRELKKAEPQLELQIESGDIVEMVDLIQGNTIDLALGVAPESKEGGLELRPVFTDELMLVFAPSHPWALGRPISREELRAQPVIFYQRSSITARMVQEFYRKLDLVPKTIMEVASIEAIKELVKLNLGISVLAPWTVDSELESGTLKTRPFGSQKLRREWVLAFLAGRRLSLAEETFYKLCQTHAAGMRLDRQG